MGDFYGICNIKRGGLALLGILRGSRCGGDVRFGRGGRLDRGRLWRLRRGIIGGFRGLGQGGLFGVGYIFWRER